MRISKKLKSSMLEVIRVYGKSDIRRIHRDLKELIYTDFEHVDCGLCASVGAHELVQLLAPHWKGYSGNRLYPVKCPKSLQNNKYVNSIKTLYGVDIDHAVYIAGSDKYTGTYGRSRRALADYLVRCLDYMIEELL